MRYRLVLATLLGGKPGLVNVLGSWGGPCLLDRLMTGCGTGNITNPPPDLIGTEVTTMNNSAFTQDL